MQTNKSLILTSLTALGVVFGDIGTSPLYALKECFTHGGIAITEANILGILSLIFWTLTLVISVKYMGMVLRADNKGEGGVLSLLALAQRSLSPAEHKKKRMLTLVGLLGAAFLYGDGAITPALSVLSAAEGLQFIAPDFSIFVVPLTIVLITLVFVAQQGGVSRIGAVFGPILLTWFVVLALLGVDGILKNPHVLEAISPLHALDFFLNNGKIGFLILGAVFLVVTGGESIYADMGHFGKRPLRLVWFSCVWPALMLNYFGQGALLLDHPEYAANPFYKLVPSWALIPVVILASAATVIASQALISGVFSITRQAVQLGYCPRLNIVHTSSKEIGQIYIPAVNWSLYCVVIYLVLTFRSSTAIAPAYGIAVTMTMLITSGLLSFVAVSKWKWSLLKCVLIFGPFMIIDVAFVGANLQKILHGGFIPLILAAVIYTLMTTWQKGRAHLYRRLKERSISIEEFCYNILKRPPLRIPGTAIYMSGDAWGAPVPLLHNLKHNKVLHQRVAILTIRTLEVPYATKEDHVSIQEIMPNMFRIIASYGFMEIPKMKHILEACREEGIFFNVQETTFVMGRETILPDKRKRESSGMSYWRERIFAVMSKNAQRPTAFFKIPPNQVIEVGIQVEI